MNTSSLSNLPSGSIGSGASPIQQRRQNPSCCRNRWCQFLAVFVLMLPCTVAFGLTMAAYKPPVKSSVSRIRNNRYSDHVHHDKPQSRSSTHKSAYVGALAPSTQPTRPKSFEKRMRELVVGVPNPQQTTKKAAPEGSRKLPSNVYTVQTLADYKKIVGDEKDKVVAVRFHAPWCRACKAMAPMFYHLANRHSDVVFVDVPVSPENANLHQGLGVQSLPYGHIYDPESGLVEELSVTKKNMPEFEEKLRSYLH